MKALQVSEMYLDNPVLIGIYTAVIAAFVNLLSHLITFYLSSRKENKIWLKDRLQNVYGDCIQTLSLVTTLSFAVQSNLDIIENSVAESKKHLALVLAYSKSVCLKEFPDFETCVLLFIQGQYSDLIRSLPPEESSNLSNRYVGKDNQHLCLSSELMLRRVVYILCSDDRLTPNLKSQNKAEDKS